MLVGFRITAVPRNAYNSWRAMHCDVIGKVINVSSYS